MVKFNSILIRPGEFMVRRGSPIRNMMLRRLEESVRRTLAKNGFSGFKTEINGPRIIVKGVEDPVKASVKLAAVFGVSSVSPAISIKTRIQSLTGSLIEIVKERKPLSLMLIVTGEFNGLRPRELTWVLAGELKKQLMIRFDLENPDLTIGIDVRRDESYIYTDVYRGVGGLPYGVEGCMVTLVSGGIDSAVAAWLTMKRGVRVIPLYIDYGKYWPREAHERFDKMMEKIYELTPWDHLKYYRVRGMEKLLLSVKEAIPARLTCLFCKANMYRVAGYVAREERCPAFSTGESVGQVASQTLSNMSILTRLSPLPVLRPLAFHDKEEIARIARTLGLEELMRKTGQCLLKPENPETNASERDLEILSETLRRTEDYAKKLYLEGREVGVLP